VDYDMEAVAIWTSGGGDSGGLSQDRVRRACLEEVLPGMETFVLATHGPWWTQLTNLIDAFDNRAALGAEDYGSFGPHVIGDANTQAADEAGAQAFAEGG
jgi:hypothetical protein